MTDKDPDFLPSNSSDVSDDQSSTPIPYIRSSKCASKRRRKPVFKGIRRPKLSRSQSEFQEPCSPIPTQSSQSSSFSNITALKLGTPSTTSSKKIVKLKLSDDEDKITTATVSNGNLVLNSNVLQSVFDMLSICSYCREGKLQLYEIGKASCRFVIECNICDYYKRFWSVSGYFGSQKIKLSENVVIPKKKLYGLFISVRRSSYW